MDEFLSRYPRSTWANSSAEVPFPQLKEYIQKYQDPQAADSIMKIQKELDETKIVLHKTIESVLERGEPNLGHCIAVLQNEDCGIAC